MIPATSSDVADYLTRIDVPAPGPANIATLRAVVAGHAQTIAFENLDPFSGREVLLEPAALAAKLVRGRPAGAPVPARGHMLLRVDLAEGPHIVDVGFGGLTLTGVLALEPDVEQTTSHEPFRLRPDGSGLLMQALVAASGAHCTASTSPGRALPARPLRAARPRCGVHLVVLSSRGPQRRSPRETPAAALRRKL